MVASFTGPMELILTVRDEVAARKQFPVGKPGTTLVYSVTFRLDWYLHPPGEWNPYGPPRK